MADRTFIFPGNEEALPMATKHQVRGTKRTCQNATCGQPFYDLARDPILCPMCGSTYNLSITPAAIAAAAAEEKAARKAAKKPVFVEPEAVVDEAVAEGAEVIPEIEGVEEPAAGEADETFLEEEEEEGDVSGIIGGVAEGEEEV